MTYNFKPAVGMTFTCKPGKRILQILQIVYCFQANCYGNAQANQMRQILHLG